MFPKFRDDLRIAESIIYENKRYFLLRDILLKGWDHPGYKVSSSVLLIAKFCDGNTPVKKILEKIQTEYSIKITFNKVNNALNKLEEYNLLDYENYIKIKREIIRNFKKEKIRKPAFEGIMYSASSENLYKQIEDCFLLNNGPGLLPIKQYNEPIKAIVAPHGSLNVSGSCAVWAYNELGKTELPDIIILLGVNHAYNKGSIEIMLKDFLTPLGRIEVDKEFCNRLIKNSNTKIDINTLAHYREHSIEIQLPFLQFISKSQSKSFKIVPIIFSHIKNYEKFPIESNDIKYLRIFADALRKTIYESKINSCIVVSGDFTHYGIYHNYAPFKNNVIERIKKIDEHSFKLIEDSNSDGFFNHANKTTYCCTYPVYVLLNTINSNEIKLLNYYIHSINDNEIVNTFASFIFK